MTIALSPQREVELLQQYHQNHVELQKQQETLNQQKAGTDNYWRKKREAGAKPTLTRAQHLCHECGVAIPKGTCVHVRTVIRPGSHSDGFGHFETWYFCPDCLEVK